MSFTNTWVRGPVGIDADARVARHGRRTFRTAATITTARNRPHTVLHFTKATWEPTLCHDTPDA